MKKRKKESVKKSIFAMFLTVLLLLCGAFAFEMGQEGKAICLIMCSLYLAMWVQAVIIRDGLNAKLEEIKDEISNSGAVEKSPSTNAEKSEGSHR